MVRTINRQPYTVKQLDYGDVKYKFFNHSNWKGVCDDKNYLGVDQETFADSKNVYVDSEGILKSRPSVKQYIMTQQGLQYIYDVWTFGQWTVYKTGDTSLVFVKGDKVSQTLNTTNKDFKLIFADEKIFIFEPNKLWYVDLTAETISEMLDGKDKIYVPVTKYVVLGKETSQESPNVLTTSYITRYSYTKGESVAELIGKTGTVKIGDDTYVVTFDDFTELTFVKRIRKLTNKNYINGEPLVFVNEGLGYVLIGEWNDDTAYTLYYSNDNVIFQSLPVLEGQLSKNYTLLPAISQSKDHVYAVLYKDDGPYAYTIFYASNSNIIPFPTWTKMIDPDASDTPYTYKYDSGIPSSDFNIPIHISYTYQRTKDEAISGSPGYYYDEKIFGVYLVGYRLHGDNNELVQSVACHCITYNTTKHTNNKIYAKYQNFEPQLCTIFCKDYYIAVRNNSSLVLKCSNTDIIKGISFGYDILCNIKYSRQIQFSSVQDIIYCDVLEPRNYTVSSSPEEVMLKLVRRKLSYNESLYESSVTNYKDYSTKTSINLPGDAKIEITYTNSRPNLFSTKFLISSYLTTCITFKYYMYGNDYTKLLVEGMPVGMSDGFYIVNNNTLYTSNFDDAVQVDVLTQGKLTFDVFDHETELSQFFLSKGKNLYINAQGSNVGVNDFKWYFPERNVQEFDYEITNLHPISTTEIAVFLQDSIYYVKPVTTTIDGIETVAYSYYKSRIPLGCEQGSDVITSYDNKYTMFVTKRGFVAMSYQDFISSEEQALTFLSDTIYDMFNEWNQGAIKLFQYNFWIILYRTNTGKAFIFDMRGNSWWPIEYNSNVKKFIEIDRKPLLLSGLYLYKLDSSNDNYFDGNSLKDGRIDWYLSSQKLHLDAINYYKHIVNLTFFGYNYGDKDVNVRFNLRVVNYRKQTDTNETKSFSAVDYKIQLTRTFVTRINYYKVNQVQYILESSRDEDAEDKIPVPLSLTAISLKYLVTGQVR